FALLSISLVVANLSPHTQLMLRPDKHLFYLQIHHPYLLLSLGACALENLIPRTLPFYEYAGFVNRYRLLNLALLGCTAPWNFLFPSDSVQHAVNYNFRARLPLLRRYLHLSLLQPHM